MGACTDECSDCLALFAQACGQDWRISSDLVSTANRSAKLEKEVRTHACGLCRHAHMIGAYHLILSAQRIDLPSSRGRCARLRARITISQACAHDWRISSDPIRTANRSARLEREVRTSACPDYD